MEAELEALRKEKEDLERRHRRNALRQERDRLRAEVEQLRQPGLLQETNRVAAYFQEMEEGRTGGNRGVPSLSQNVPSLPQPREVPEWQGSVSDITILSGKSNMLEVAHNLVERKARSGIMSKVTDYVKCPQLWPHVVLQDEYLSKDMGFMDLDFRLLVAGELEIVTSSQTTELEKKGRLALLKQLAYLLGVYEWTLLRNVYIAIIRKIEIGHMNWGSDFNPEIQWMITKLGSGLVGNKGVKSRVKQSTAKDAESVGGSQSVSDKVWFCREFQRNKCLYQEPHTGSIGGRLVVLQHICAKCWIKGRTKAGHPESARECPNRD
jgi:hypothetical protein